jgi:hypothetical protein
MVLHNHSPDEKNHRQPNTLKAIIKCQAAQPVR